MITDARTTGMSVADLKLLLGYMEHGDPGGIDINSFLDDRIRRLQHTIRQSRKFLKTLKLTRAALVVPVIPEVKSENAT